MKNTGITRRLDQLGRIVIPIELRRILHLGEKDAVDVYTEGKRLIFEKHEEKCCFCGSTDGLKEFKAKKICFECINLCKTK